VLFRSDSVDPVQLSIRLLVPEGSLLLAQAELREHLRGYDADSFSHLWRHPDPAMDELQRVLASLVAADADAGVEPRQTHVAIRQATARVAERAGVPWPAAARRLPEASPPRPRLSEPWFCCAEPTAAQRAGVGSLS